MIPIKDYLNAYTSTMLSTGTSTMLSVRLSQSDVEPEMVFSLRRGVHQDRQSTQAGTVSDSPSSLLSSIPPELLNNLFIQGDNPMNNQSPPTRVRICSHITQSRFLHVEDALGLGDGKIRLFAGTYRRNQGMNAHGHHFFDIADARVIFSALARGEQGFTHKEYKGTPPRDGNPAVSRVLSVVIKGGNVYIELKTGPGKLTNTGAIKPNGPAKAEVNVGFKLYEARRMGASVLAYIHAWDVMRMMVNQEMVSKPPPYTSTPLSTGTSTPLSTGTSTPLSTDPLISAASEASGVKTAPANGVSKPNGATRPPIVAANNSLPPRSACPREGVGRGGRPVTRKTGNPTATTTKPSPPPATNSLPPRSACPREGVGRGGRSQNGHAKQNDNNSPPQPLLYGDGTPVAANNQTERNTYTRYQQAKGVVPLSKNVLLQYYQQQTAV